MLDLNLENNLNDAGQKKKQKLVKHKRKNWKKTDISEIEQGIEELRQEERTGGVRAEKKDEDLFFISKNKLSLLDEEADSHHEHDDAQRPTKRAKLSLEEKLKNMSCYRNLQPDPHSAPALRQKAISSPKLDSKKQAKKTEILATKYSARLQAKKRAKTAEKLFNNKKDEAEEKSKAKRDRFYTLTESNFKNDIWTSKDVGSKSIEKKRLEEEENDYLAPTKKIDPKRAKNPLRKDSALPRVALPHPGMSYNPDYDDHQDLLLKAHVVELRKLNDEQKLMRRLKDNLKKMSWKEIEDIWLQEMSVKNLFEHEDDGETNQALQDEIKQFVQFTSKAGKEKKTSKQKKKQLVEKLKQKQLENKKKARIQQNEIFRIKSIKKELKKSEDEQKERKLKKDIEEMHRELFGAKRLGRLKFEEAELEVKLSDELTGNLRNLKPEGNILSDRYKSLQKRNLIEPREKAKRYRKFWIKRFEKKNAHEKTYGL